MQSKVRFIPSPSSDSSVNHAIQSVSRPLSQTHLKDNGDEADLATSPIDDEYVRE